MKNIWLNKEFKALKINTKSEIAKQCEDLWQKLPILENDKTISDEINKEWFEENKNAQPNAFGIFSAPCITYTIKIKNNEYLLFLKDKIVPMLRVIKNKLSEIQMYFLIIDSFVSLANKYKELEKDNPNEFTLNCILSQPLFNIYWNLLKEKVTLNLYSLFDPATNVDPSDANFQSLFQSIKKCQINEIKVELFLREKSIEKTLSLNDIKDYLNSVNKTIINNFFKKKGSRLCVPST